MLASGDLASIPDQTTMDFMKDYIAKGVAAWVGGFNDDGVWKWLDGTTFAFTNWKTSEPNGDGPYFVLATGDNKWNDLSGDYNKTYVCQYDPK